MCLATPSTLSCYHDRIPNGSSQLDRLTDVRAMVTVWQADNVDLAPRLLLNGFDDLRLKVRRENDVLFTEDIRDRDVFVRGISQFSDEAHCRMARHLLDLFDALFEREF